MKFPFSLTAYTVHGCTPSSARMKPLRSYFDATASSLTPSFLHTPPTHRNDDSWLALLPGTMHRNAEIFEHECFGLIRVKNFESTPMNIERELSGLFVKDFRFACTEMHGCTCICSRGFQSVQFSYR